MKEYKIGDFAKELGVTHDFLKHYETHGLITPNTSDAGYRYYSFVQSLRVIQCLQLKNLDFTLKEMEEVFNDFNYAKIVDTFPNKIANYKKQISELQAKIQILEFIEKQKEELEHIESKWSINDNIEFYFYKHTSKDSFISNEEVQALTRSWIQAIPFVQSSCVIKNLDLTSESPILEEVYWGFSTNQAMLDTFGLLKNDSVEHIFLGKTLIFSYYGDDPLFKNEYEHWHNARLSDALKVVKEHNFKLNGDIYQVYFIANSSRAPQKVHYMTFIPIK